MEGSKFQGDLADVVRASGGCGAVRDMDVSNCRKITSYPVLQVPLNINNEGFGDPFSSMRDPLEDPLEGVGDAHFLLDDTTSTLVIPPAFQKISTTGRDHHRYTHNINNNNDNNISISDDQMRINDFQGPPSGVCVHRLMTPISPKAAQGSLSFIDTSAARPQISSPPRNSIIKRRKSQAKKVVCIPAPTAANSRQGGGEVVPSDLWAWRKYGQKPIKGSPFPRGYYRCSSSKGCSARKQVERSRTDPNMLVITYTSEHNHPWPTQRNALAGSSRISPSISSPSNNVTESSTSNPNPSPQQPNTKTNVKEEVDHIVSNGNDPARAGAGAAAKIYVEDLGNGVVPNQLMMNDLVIDYDQSYRPVMQEEASISCGLGGDHDFFADLRELEADDLLFSRGSGSKSVLDVDPFGCLFDWPTSNSTTTNSDNTNTHQNS